MVPTDLFNAPVADFSAPHPLGGWSFALEDYLNQGVMAYLNQPQFKAMASIVDPWTYKDRLTMPKLVLCAAGDEFFLPDSPQFFLKQLPGETYLNVPCSHKNRRAL